MASSTDASGNNPPLWGRALLVWGSVALASIVLLWMFAYVERVEDQNQAEVDGRRRVISLTNSYAKQLQISIEKIDQLSLLIARVASAGTKSVTRHIFQDLPSYGWFNPLLIDQYGIVQSARTSSAVGLSVANTRFFRDHRDSTSTDLKINPLESGVGSLAGKQVVRFSRRVNDEQGRFAGVISLSVLPDQLTELSEVIVLDIGDAIGVKYTNGDTLLRHDIGHEYSRDNFDILSGADANLNFFRKSVCRAA